MAPEAALDANKPINGEFAICTRAKKHLGTLEVGLELDYSTVSSFEINEHMAASDLSLPLFPESTQEARDAALAAHGTAASAVAPAECARTPRGQAPPLPSVASAQRSPKSTSKRPPSASLSALKRQQGRRTAPARSRTPPRRGEGSGVPEVTAAPSTPPTRQPRDVEVTDAQRTPVAAFATPSVSHPPMTPSMGVATGSRTPAEALSALLTRGRKLRSRMADAASGIRLSDGDEAAAGIVAAAAAAARAAPDCPPPEPGTAAPVPASERNTVAAPRLPLPPAELQTSPESLRFSFDVAGLQTQHDAATPKAGAAECAAARDGLQDALAAADAAISGGGGSAWRTLEGEGVDASLILALNGVGLGSEDEEDEEADARSDGSSEISLREYHEVMHGGAGDGDDSGTEVDELRCEVKVSVGKVLVANGALADARLVVSIARGVSGGSANAATQPMSSASLAPSLVGGREIVFNQTATLRCARLPERAVLRLCGSRVSVAGVRVSLEGDVEVPLAGCAAVASAMLRAADGDVAEGDLVATADAVVAAGDVRLPLVGADADAEADREQDAPEQAPGAGVLARVVSWAPSSSRACAALEDGAAVWAVAKPLGGGRAATTRRLPAVKLTVPGAGSAPGGAEPFAVLARPASAAEAPAARPLLVLELWTAGDGAAAQPSLLGVVRVPLPPPPEVEGEVTPLSVAACDVYDVYVGASVGTVAVEVACGDVAALLELADRRVRVGDESDAEGDASYDERTADGAGGSGAVDEHSFELTVWSLQGASWQGDEEYYVAYLWPGERVPMFSQAVVTKRGAAARFNAFAAHGIELRCGENLLEGFRERLEAHAATVAERVAEIGDGGDGVDGADATVAQNTARAAAAGHVRFEVWRRAPFGDYVVATAALLTTEIERLTSARLDAVAPRLKGRADNPSPLSESGETLAPTPYALPLITAGTDEGASGIDWSVASLHVRLAYRPTPPQLLAHRRRRAEVEAARFAPPTLGPLAGAALRLRVEALRDLPEALCVAPAGRPPVPARVRVRGSLFPHDAALEARFMPFNTRAVPAREGELAVEHVEELVLGDEPAIRAALQSHCALLELWAAEGIRENDDVTDMWLGTAAVPLRATYQQAASGTHAAWYDVVSRRGINVGAVRVSLELELAREPEPESALAATTGEGAGAKAQDEAHAEPSESAEAAAHVETGTELTDIAATEVAATEASAEAERAQPGAGAEATAAEACPCSEREHLAEPAGKTDDAAEPAAAVVTNGAPAATAATTSTFQLPLGLPLPPLPQGPIDDSWDLGRLRESICELEAAVGRVAHQRDGAGMPQVKQGSVATPDGGDAAAAAPVATITTEVRDLAVVALHEAPAEPAEVDLDGRGDLAASLHELESIVARVADGMADDPDVTAEREAMCDTAASTIAEKDEAMFDRVAGAETGGAAAASPGLSFAGSPDPFVDDEFGGRARMHSDDTDLADAHAAVTADPEVNTAAAETAAQLQQQQLEAEAEAEAQAQAASELARSREARRLRLEARAREEAIAMVRARTASAAAAAVPPRVADALAEAAAAVGLNPAAPLDTASGVESCTENF